MPTFTIEVFQPLVCAANYTNSISSAPCNLGGFTCTVSGTLTLRAVDASGDLVVNSLPVTAGSYYPLPYAMPTGAHLTLSGGAAGTIAWTS